MVLRGLCFVALCLPALLAGCGGRRPLTPATPTRLAPNTVVTAAPAPLVAVPGSGGAGSSRFRAAADLLTLCYELTWGRHKRRMFSSGLNGNPARMRDAWRRLTRAGAEDVLSGHDHNYERFAPQDADARPTPRGMRQFVVETGANSLYDRLGRQPISEAWENRTWGVLKLTLKSGSCDWEFLSSKVPGFARRPGSGGRKPAARVTGRPIRDTRDTLCHESDARAMAGGLALVGKHSGILRSRPSRGVALVLLAFH